jgi:hypothetical protein
LFNDDDRLRLGRVQTESVDFQKYRSNRKGCALVPVNEWMILCQAIAIRSSEIKERRLWFVEDTKYRPSRLSVC